jgi:hypothetical protein
LSNNPSNAAFFSSGLNEAISACWCGRGLLSKKKKPGAILVLVIRLSLYEVVAL